MYFRSEGTFWCHLVGRKAKYIFFTGAVNEKQAKVQLQGMCRGQFYKLFYAVCQSFASCPELLNH